MHPWHPFHFPYPKQSDNYFKTFFPKVRTCRRERKKGGRISSQKRVRPWIGKQYEFRGTWPTYPDLVSWNWIPYSVIPLNKATSFVNHCWVICKSIIGRDIIARAPSCNFKGAASIGTSMRRYYNSIILYSRNVGLKYLKKFCRY